MTATEVYNFKIKAFGEQIIQLQKKNKRFNIARLVSFFGAIAVFYILFPISLLAAILAALMCLVVFGFQIVLDRKNREKMEYFQMLVKINQNELDVLNDNFAQFDPGSEFIDQGHPYTNDLDIFGKRSLFQYINRTSSLLGKTSLANLFSSLLPEDEIEEQQAAVKELAKEVDWRQDIMAHSGLHKKKEDAIEKINEWLQSKDLFHGNRRMKIAITIFPILALSALALTFFGFTAVPVYLLVFISFVVNYLTFRKVGRVHNQVSRSDEQLKSFNKLLKLIENKEFKSGKLIQLQKKIKGEGTAASSHIYRLSKLGKRLDYRLNVYVSFFLNLFLLWDLHHVFLIEKWKNIHKDTVPQWFESIGSFEALIGLGTLSFNHKDWLFPSLTEKHFHLEGKEIGHPLLPAKQRISNDFSLLGSGKIALVTGSNMSGKTTFLRTLGINLVLAQIGAPVCAKVFNFSAIKIHTSMRIIDSLAENTSSFYAELKRLNGILQSVKSKDKVLLLLDEILRGTNSRDRHIGSEALIRQLIQNNAVGLLATHDLELSKLEEEIPGHVFNYNFDVQIEGKELFFDYKLHTGVCKSMNATLLMEKMGIEI
jgi:DNA mismatch repair ATPase MutS